MPPPTISWSTFFASARAPSAWSTPSSRRRSRPAAASGFASALPSASSSAASSGPAHGDRREARHAVRARLGAVRGAERVHHVDVAERGHLARESLVVLLLALVEARVLEQHDFARLHVDAVRPSPSPARTLLPSSLGEAASRPARASPPALSSPSFGRPRCDVTITARPASSACSDRRHRGADARVVGDDLPSSTGTLRSSRMKTRLPRRSRSDMRLNFMRRGARLATGDATSSMRLEKPHSLSYHEQTLTSVPSMTLVRSRRRSTTPGCG